MPKTEKSVPHLPSQNQEIEFVRSDSFLKVYANSAQIESSLWDIRLVFGELVRFGGKNRIEQHVSIVMSPQHAKALLTALRNNLGEYEKKFGEIKLPSEESTSKDRSPKT